MKAQRQPLNLVFIVLSLILMIPTLAKSEGLVETRKLDSFNKIIATNGINIILRKSSEEKAEIKIDNALLSDVITEVKNGTLKLKMRPQINKELSVLVVLYYNDLVEISVTKGATLETKNVMLTDRLIMNVNTGGSIKAEIECTDIKLSAGGGATASLYGWAQRFEVNASTKAKVQTQTLNVDKAIIKAHTGAEVWVKPKDYLEALANTGGTIYYTSTPKKINQKLSSGGELRNKSMKHEGELTKDIKS